MKNLHTKLENEEYEKHIATEKDKDKEINRLRQLLDDTINDKDTRKKEIILEEEINKLKEELQKEKSKGFFKKLFNL